MKLFKFLQQDLLTDSVLQNDYIDTLKLKIKFIEKSDSIKMPWWLLEKTTSNPLNESPSYIGTVLDYYRRIK